QNYPNPFNPATRLSFDVPVAANVTLKVYNPLGAEVATLVNRDMNPGHHSVDFDGAQLTSGLYFYSIQVGDAYKATRKMLLVK
ncbi:T9SS C-terminal target domain-containing protein, partial [candidate division KSB1 bacterium]